MIIESALLLGTASYLYNTANKDSIEKRKLKRDIKNRWQILMDSLGNRIENKLEQEYELLDIIPKEYGFDSLVSLPHGISSVEFRKLIPLIQQTYKAEVIAEPSVHKNTMYMRVHFQGNNIGEKDVVRFKWYKFFHTGNDFRNSFGETYKINSINPLKDPAKNIVGYKMNIEIPSQLSYSTLLTAMNDLSKTLGKCYLDFNPKEMKTECTVVTVPIDDTTKYAPIKLKTPMQLYFGMGYDYEPVVVDYKTVPHTLIGGETGAGKTSAFIMAFINLCIQFDNVEIVVGMMSEKDDFRIFKNVKQCKYYSNKADTTIKLLKYLNKEMSRRFKLFNDISNDTVYCSNIHKYNSLVKPKNRLNVIHFISDEVADFMAKPQTGDMLWNLARKCRACGIYITTATQRGSKANINPEFKAMLANKLSFYQPNTASALTIMSGEGMANRVTSLEKHREFLCDGSDGVKIGKTLYLDEDMMIDLLKDKLDLDGKNKIELDNNGNIIKEIKEISPKTEGKPIDSVEVKLNKEINGKKSFKNINGR